MFKPHNLYYFSYVQPIPAPHIIKEVAVVNALKGCQLAAHIVSCIPLVVHPIVCSYSSNVWMTIDQVDQYPFRY
jgi:hypothetical protein